MFRVCALWLVFATTAQQCVVKFDVHLIQDTSWFVADYVDLTKQSIQFIDAQLQWYYPGSRLAVSFTSDKPIPYSGCGSYASYNADQYGLQESDFCTRLVKSFCSESLIPVPVLPTCPQGDFKQDAIGALLSTLDMDCPCDASQEHIQVVMLSTGSTTHLPGAAQANINKWNDNWGYAEKMDLNLFAPGFCYPGSSYMQELLRLGPKYREDPASLTAEENEIFKGVLETCGPFPFPDVQPCWPSSANSCAQTEYAKFEDLGLVAAKKRVAVLVTEANTVEEIQPDEYCNSSGMGVTECVKFLWEELLMALPEPHEPWTVKSVGSLVQMPRVIFRVLEEFTHGICWA